MSKILVTGGAGFLGSVLVPMLLEHHHEVTVVDNFNYGQYLALSTCCASSHFKFFLGDVRDQHTIRSLVPNIDVVIPLAALVGASACSQDKASATETNLEAIRNLCNILSTEQLLLFPNTNSGYGSGTLCTEKDTLHPISLYGTTKSEAESIVLDRSESVSFRFATLYGVSPRMRMDLLLNEFVWCAYRDRMVVLFEAEFRRNFCHVRDAAKAIIHTINNFTLMRGNVYNVGDSAANLTKRQLCEKIATHLPGINIITAQIGEDPDKRDYTVSNAKIEATGWWPDFTIDDGITELLKLYSGLPRSVFGNI